MDFGEALSLLRDGRLLCRKGWNGKGMWLRLRLLEGTEHLPYIEMKTVDNHLVPWVASQSDLLAFDWETAD